LKKHSSSKRLKPYMWFIHLLIFLLIQKYVVGQQGAYEAKWPISSFLAGTPITRWPLLLWGLLETSLQEMTFRRRCVCVWTDVFIHHHVW